MNPDADFATGHTYVNDNPAWSYLILGRTAFAVVYFIPEKKKSDVSVSALVQPIHNDWQHSPSCRCQGHKV